MKRPGFRIVSPLFPLLVLVLAFALVQSPTARAADAGGPDETITVMFTNDVLGQIAPSG